MKFLDELKISNIKLQTTPIYFKLFNSSDIRKLKILYYYFRKRRDTDITLYDSYNYTDCIKLFNHKNFYNVFIITKKIEVKYYCGENYFKYISFDIVL